MEGIRIWIFKCMKKWILLIMLLFPLLPTWAVKVTSLYQAELPVTTQTDEDRKQAMQRGFIEVLIGVSGNPNIAKNPIVKAALHRADYYVQDFTYSSVSTTAWEYHILIHYDKADVNRLLRRAGVPYWGENRPLILVWLTMTSGPHEAEIVGNETPNDILTIMKQQGKKYGLPLIFPIMDMSDIGQVSANDIDQFALPVLKEAGKRYAPDAILVGKITTNNNGCQSQWHLILDDNQWDWVVSDKSTTNAISSVLNRVSQTLAKHYIVKTTSASKLSFILEVSNIMQHSDLNQLMDYLKQLTQVQHVQLAQVSGDVVQLSVQVRGSLHTFRQNASIGQHLVLKSQDVASNKLIYQWMH